jgi:hypothetical protein
LSTAPLATAGLTAAGAAATGVAIAVGWAIFSSSRSGLQVQLVKMNIKPATKAKVRIIFFVFIQNSFF